MADFDFSAEKAFQDPVSKFKALVGHKGSLGKVALRLEVFETLLKGKTAFQGFPKVLLNVFLDFLIG
tara:strand:+ start:2908 stop:3108 length:201 start_codon:yes stop_codon:yes gene_type:complete